MEHDPAEIQTIFYRGDTVSYATVERPTPHRAPARLVSAHELPSDEITLEGGGVDAKLNPVMVARDRNGNRHALDLHAMHNLPPGAFLMIQNAITTVLIVLQAAREVARSSPTI